MESTFEVARSVTLLDRSEEAAHESVLTLAQDYEQEIQEAEMLAWTAFKEC